MNINRFKLCFFALFACLVVASCKKDNSEILKTGNVKVSFNAVVNSDQPESYYCRLYVFEDYPSKPALRSQYIGVESSIDGKTRMVFNDLNPGNYIVTYYRNRVIVNNTVQVTAGKTSDYDF